MRRSLLLLLLLLLLGLVALWSPSFREERRLRESPTVLHNSLDRSGSSLLPNRTPKTIASQTPNLPSTRLSDLGPILRGIEVTDNAVHVLRLTEAQKFELENILYDGLENVKRIEADNAKVVTDENGASFYRIAHDPGRHTSLTQEMALRIDGLLGREQASALVAHLATTATFRQQPNTREVFFNLSDAGELTFKEIRYRADPKASPQVYEKTIGPNGLERMTQRWDHLFDVSAWLEYLQPETATETSFHLESVTAK